MKKFSFLAIISALLVSTSCLDREDTNQLLNDQVIRIDQYIEINHADDFVFYDASGIRFVVKQFGDMPPAKIGQDITVDIEGKVFEGNANFQDETLNTKLENISVEGLRYVMSNVMVGSEIIAYIPSIFAFGENGSGSVPGNTIVVYEFEITSATPTTTQLNQLVTDTLAIRAYFTNNQIENVKRLPSGVYYKINDGGSGSSAHVYEQVTFSYDGKLLSNGSTFDDGRLTSMVFNLIDGFKVVIPKLKEGDKATLFIPSLYGYGTTQSTTIPANSVLIFDITLENVAN